MDLQTIADKATKAILEISDNNPTTWSTPELNICNHLSERLRKYFPDYDVDVELIKHNLRRPDIVIHKRGTNDHNLVVFQVKKHPTTKDVADDLEKIKATFFQQPYNYQYGIFVSVKALPEVLPDFDKNKIKLIQISGWKITQ